MFSLLKKKKKRKRKASVVPETEVAHGQQPTAGCDVVCVSQAQSIIKVIVLFHRGKQALLFFLLISARLSAISVPAGQSFGKGV